MYRPHPWVPNPEDPDISIWRYLRHERFFDVIQNRRLHFARLDQFEDEWEGLLPEGTPPLAKDHFQNIPIRSGDKLTDFQMHLRGVGLFNKLCAYANCWYVNGHESDGMWRLYGSSGVAVQSTFSRLCASLADDAEPVHVGLVNYVDFAGGQPPTYGNILSAAFNKRQEYEHERELRAVVVTMPTGWTSGDPPYHELRGSHPNHQKIAIDPNILIKRVVIAPNHAEKLLEPTRELLENAGLDIPVEPSRLDFRPTLVRRA